jgi:hypothetical protein
MRLSYDTRTGYNTMPYFTGYQRQPMNTSVQPRANQQYGTYGTQTGRPATPGMNSAAPFGYQRPGQSGGRNWGRHYLMQQQQRRPAGYQSPFAGMSQLQVAGALHSGFGGPQLQTTQQLYGGYGGFGGGGFGNFGGLGRSETQFTGQGGAQAGAQNPMFQSPLFQMLWRRRNAKIPGTPLGSLFIG